MPKQYILLEEDIKHVSRVCSRCILNLSDKTTDYFKSIIFGEIPATQYKEFF